MSQTLEIQCRLIIDPPAGGSWNMSLDQAMLDYCLISQTPTLRFYQWSEPTLSLGYFQQVDQRNEHLESGHCPLLRRATGGGAIVHDQELTYSLAVPPKLVPKKATILYDWAHDAMCQILNQVGIVAQKYDVSIPRAPEATVAPQSFLCFQRRADGDVIVLPDQSKTSLNTGLQFLGNKVLGSAQRKRDRAILQHGSILLSRSKAAPQLPGIHDLCENQQKVDVETLTLGLSQAIASSTGWSMSEGQWLPEEIEMAKDWKLQRFANDVWNHSR